MAELTRTALLIAHECAPHNSPAATVGAQRPAQLAKHLPEFGWRVIVLCRDASAPEEMPSPRIAERVHAALDASRDASTVVIPLPAAPWDGAIDRAWRALAPADGPRPVRDAMRKPLTLLKWFVGDQSQNWHSVGRTAGDAAIERARPDLLIGEHSPAAGMFIARELSARHRIPWVADFRDPMLFALPPRLRPVYEPRARQLVRSAAAIVSVSPSQVEIDAQVYGRPPELVTNGFDEAEFAGPEPPPFDRATIAYLGTIWLAREFEIVLEGLTLMRTRDPRLADRLRLLYRGVGHEMVRRLVDEHQVSELADVAPPVGRGEALEIMRRADALLLLAPRGHDDPYRRRGVYPGKTFEYLGAARPIMCVPGDGGVLDELLGRTRAGVSLPTPEGVARYLEMLIREREQGRRAAYDAVSSERMKYTRRHQTERFARILNDVVHERRRS